MDLVEEKGFIPQDLVENEVSWFYDELGIDDMYFSTETVEVIATHIHSLYAGKIAAYARDDKLLEIRLDKEAADHAVYIDTSKPGYSAIGGPQYEQRIDTKYLNPSKAGNSYRVETFRSASKLPGGHEQQLRCYFVYKCDFVNANPDPSETRLDEIGDKKFLQKTTAKTKEIYQDIIRLAFDRAGPVIEVLDQENNAKEKRLVVAYKQGSALGFFSALSDLYHYYGLTSSRKYVEQFSNGITVISLYLQQAKTTSRHPAVEASIYQIVKEVSLLYCIPHNRLQTQFATGNLSLQEAVYAHCVWVFVGHFLNRLGKSHEIVLTKGPPPLTLVRFRVQHSCVNAGCQQQHSCRTALQDQAPSQERNLHC